MLLVGSQAFDFGRVPSDIDYIATPGELELFKEVNSDKIVLVKPTKFGETIFMQGSDPVEFDTSETGQELMFISDKDYDLARLQHDGHLIAEPNLLLTLKMSHRFLKNSPHFLKTMKDIWYLRMLGATVPESLTDWLKRRSKVTYDYGHPSLKRNKENFFSNDEVPYIYDHDTIHESVKTFSTPAFELIKDDAAEVFCSKEKFMAQPEEIKLATVLEESLTLALERSQIPFNFEPDRYKSFTTALEKVCTSIASGWWRTYAWENYFTVLEMYNENYVDRFKTALSEGIIKPYA
jgi:hypothetical protein